MKKIFKIFGIAAGVLVVIILAGILYFNTAFPKVDPPANVKVEITPERISRGAYLTNHVTVCLDCHSKRDWTKFTGPVTPGTLGGGGDVFDENLGFPGKVMMKNITPASIGNWSDGELIRAITCGVTKDNRALFPMMPYPNYNKLDQEDLYSIVAYIRNLKPIENKLPDTELNFPLNFIVKTMPIKSRNPMKFDRNNPLEYGKYLATLAGCIDCHTQSEKGKPLPGMEFAGGEGFQLLPGLVKSANISPDNETGIGLWTKETFIKRFKDFSNDSAKVISVSENEFNTPMPWTMYAGMTEEDLNAIYDYLRTVKPVHNIVERFKPTNIAKK